MSRPCVFCGGGPVTAEHVLPSWLKSAFDPGDLEHGFSFQASDDRVRAYKQKLLHNTVKAPCAGCNNGWMSRLEDGVRDLLPEMINGRRVGMNAVRQEALATWSIKTILMFAKMHRPSEIIIPESDYTDLFDNRQPSRFMTARLARTAPPEQGSVVTMVDFTCPAFSGPPGVAAYIATLRIGHFVVQFLRVGPLDERMQLTPLPPMAQTISLWPPTTAERRWPPLIPIAGSDWEAFTNPNDLLSTVQLAQ